MGVGHPVFIMGIDTHLTQSTLDEITRFRISETWRKHAIPCFRYIYVSRKRENLSATRFRHVSGTEIAK